MVEKEREVEIKEIDQEIEDIKNSRFEVYFSGDRRRKIG